MRKAIPAVLTVLAVGATSAHAENHYSKGCNSRTCERRVCTTARCKDRWYHQHHHATATAASADDRVWLYNTRMCESGGIYTTNTGNGFYGAYQFTISSWVAAGGSGNPAQAPPAEQDTRALILRRIQGTGAWPNCG